jgi:hypothetical protein
MRCNKYWSCAAGLNLIAKIKKRGRGAAAPARVGPGGNPSRRGLRGRAPSGAWGGAP